MDLSYLENEIFLQVRVARSLISRSKVTARGEFPPLCRYDTM